MTQAILLNKSKSILINKNSEYKCEFLFLNINSRLFYISKGTLRFVGIEFSEIKSLAKFEKENAVNFTTEI